MTELDNVIEFKYNYINNVKINFSLFYKRFNEITKLWLGDFPWDKFSDVCLGGGSLLSCLDESTDISTLNLDLDLFIINDTNKYISRELIEYFLNKFKGRNLYLSQKCSVITFYLEDYSYPLQIISTSYTTFYNVVSDFDLSSLNLWYSNNELHIPYNTYFELIYGFMVLNKPIKPNRLFKYLKRGYKIVSNTCFIFDRNDDNTNGKYYTNNEPDLIKLLSDRNLIIQYESKWYPISSNSTNNNIFLLSKFLDNPIKNIYLNNFTNKIIHDDIIDYQETITPEYIRKNYNCYFIGDILLFNPGIVNSIPIKFVDYWYQKIANNGMISYYYHKLKPLIFWISGKCIFDNNNKLLLLDICCSDHPLLKDIDEMLYYEIVKTKTALAEKCKIKYNNLIVNIDHKILKRYTNKEIDYLNTNEYLGINCKYRKDIDEIFKSEREAYLTIELHIDTIRYINDKFYISPNIMRFKQYFKNN